MAQEFQIFKTGCTRPCKYTHKLAFPSCHLTWTQIWLSNESSASFELHQFFFFTKNCSDSSTPQINLWENTSKSRWEKQNSNLDYKLAQYLTGRWRIKAWSFDITRQKLKQCLYCVAACLQWCFWFWDIFGLFRCTKQGQPIQRKSVKVLNLLTRVWKQ